MNKTISNEQVGSLMSFNPTELNAFKDKGAQQDPNIYKTNPRDAVSDDGVYRSKVKILLNPKSPSDSIVNQANYWLSSMDGSRLVRSSLSEGDKNCPLFKAWKRLWFSGDEEKKEFSKEIYNKTESMWVLVQILQDENRPELVGQFRVMKLARDIYEKLVARMNPSPSTGKHPYPVMDYVIGLALEIEVQPGPDDPKAPERKQREISYSLSQFGDYATCIKTDGTPILSEEEAELVDNFVTALNDSQSGKTAKKKSDGEEKVKELKPQLSPIYQKVCAYVIENLIDLNTGEPLDLKEYCGYSEWDEQTKEFVDHFVEMTDHCINPSTMTYDQFKSLQKSSPEELESRQMITEPASPFMSEDPSEVPF